MLFVRFVLHFVRFVPQRIPRVRHHRRVAPRARDGGRHRGPKTRRDRRLDFSVSRRRGDCVAKPLDHIRHHRLAVARVVTQGLANTSRSFQLARDLGQAISQERLSLAESRAARARLGARFGDGAFVLGGARGRETQRIRQRTQTLLPVRDVRAQLTEHARRGGMRRRVCALRLAFDQTRVRECVGGVSRVALHLKLVHARARRVQLVLQPFDRDGLRAQRALPHPLHAVHLVRGNRLDYPLLHERAEHLAPAPLVTALGLRRSGRSSVALAGYHP